MFIMAYQSFFSFNVTDSNRSAKKGGRTASEQAKYLTEEEKNELKNDNQQNLSATKELAYLTDSKKIDIDETTQQSPRKNREDLAYFETGNMPKFAVQESLKNGTSVQYEFFKASEEFEPMNNKKNKEGKSKVNPSITYREIKFALPNQLISDKELKKLSIKEQEILTLERQKDLIHDFMKREGLDKLTYALAIHIKFSALEPTEKQPHVHFIFSDRLPDEFDRAKEKYFSNGAEAGRYKPKNPSEGPCRKDTRFSEKLQNDRKTNLNSLRKTAEQTINEHYIKNGLSDHWVSCEKKEVIKEIAKEKGENRTVELMNVPAREHMGEKITSKPDHYKHKKDAELKAQTQEINYKYDLLEFQNSPEFFQDKLTKTTAIQHPDSFIKGLREQGFSADIIERIVTDTPPRPLVESDTPTATSTDSLNEINQRINEINKKISDLKSSFKDKDEVTADLKSKSDIERVIADKIKNLSKNPYQTALRKFFEKTDLNIQRIRYTKNCSSIEWHKSIIAEREAMIIARHFRTNDKAREILLANLLKDNATATKINPYDICTKAERSTLRGLNRKLTELQKSTTEFSERHIKPNIEKITELQNKSAKQNSDLIKKINQLKEQLNELNKPQPTIIHTPTTTTPPTESTRSIKIELDTERNNIFKEFNENDKKVKQITLQIPLIESQIKSINENKFNNTNYLAIATLLNTKTEIVQTAWESYIKAKQDYETAKQNKSLFMPSKKEIENYDTAKAKLAERVQFWDTLLKPLGDNMQEKILAEKIRQEDSIPSLKSQIPSIQNQINNLFNRNEELLKRAEKIQSEITSIRKSELKNIHTISKNEIYKVPNRPLAEREADIVNEYRYLVNHYKASTGQETSNTILDHAIAKTLKAQGYSTETIRTALLKTENLNPAIEKPATKAIYARGIAEATNDNFKPDKTFLNLLPNLHSEPKDVPIIARVGEDIPIDLEDLNPEDREFELKSRSHQYEH